MRFWTSQRRNAWQRQKGTVVVGKESHWLTACYYIGGNLWGFHCKHAICLLTLHLRSITQRNRTARSFFGTFKNPRQPAVNDPETKGSHSERICCSAHPPYFEHFQSSEQTLSPAPASDTTVYTLRVCNSHYRKHPLPSAIGESHLKQSKSAKTPRAP